MRKFAMFVLAAITLCVAPLAKAQGVAADRLHCGADQMQVCTTPTSDGQGFMVLTDSRAHARTDCDVSQPRGVDLRCVAESDVRTAEEAACRELGGNWRWSRRHERCYQHVEREERNDGQSNGGCNSGTSTCGAGVAIAVPRCTETDLTRLATELDRIWEARLVVEDFGPLQRRAAEVYGVLVECDDGSPTSRRLIELAANMVASLEEADPAFPDYGDEFARVHEHLDNLDPIVVTPPAEEESWCTDTVAGVFVCIVLPTVVIATGIGVGAAVLYDYLDDGSPDGIIHW